MLQLADWVQSFIDTSTESYGLDPSYYVLAPALSWDAMLRHNGATLTLLTENDMYIFFERAVRGGVGMITTRHASRTILIKNDEYNPDEPTVYIQ